MPVAYTIRAATPADIPTLVAFTRQEAREAEGARLDEAAVRRGVERPFEDATLARYWVAETATPEIVASTSAVTEWSNFHGGQYWWIQSLFIVPAHRGTGLLERLIDHLTAEADAAGALDLRLYVHDANLRAIRAYHRCGFERAPSLIMRRRTPRP